jgi:hypothetical protein
MTNVTALAPVQQQHQMALEPHSITEAFDLARMACDSGMLPRAIKTPEQAMMVLMKGRELGLTAMQSFASIHVIEGKATMSAELIVAMVKRRGDVCKYFHFVDGDDKQATFETLREGNPKPTRMTFTMAQATALGLSGKDNWKKQPSNMLRWRAATALARLEYPELTLGLYSAEEMDEPAERAPSRIVMDAEVVSTTPAQVQTPANDSIEDKVVRFEKLMLDARTKDELAAVGRELKDAGVTKPERDHLASVFAASQKRIAATQQARQEATQPACNACDQVGRHAPSCPNAPDEAPGREVGEEG